MKAAIVGIAGRQLSAGEAALFRAEPPAGIILFARNIQQPSQLHDLAAELRSVLPESAVLLIDQEGGRVARLRPPYWQAHPAAGAVGMLYARDHAAGLRAAWLTGALIGGDTRDFDVVCAPVLDLVVPGAHAGVVGDRAFAADPADVAALGAAMAEGLMAAGQQPVMKHAPGHGHARIDSHQALPVVNQNRDALAADIAPFRACAGPPTGVPWAMTAHILYTAIDPDRPGTLSPVVVGEIIRGAIGFDGVLVSDDLAMSALQGAPDARALGALAAGCDLAAWCDGNPTANAAILRAVPALSADSARRMAAAREWARAGRRPGLDFAALAAERNRLLA